MKDHADAANGCLNRDSAVTGGVCQRCDVAFLRRQSMRLASCQPCCGTMLCMRRGYWRRRCRTVPMAFIQAWPQSCGVWPCAIPPQLVHRLRCGGGWSRASGIIRARVIADERKRGFALGGHGCGWSQRGAGPGAARSLRNSLPSYHAGQTSLLASRSRIC